MPLEVERRFLLKNDSWRTRAAGVRMEQAYFAIGPAVVRVRIAGSEAKLTLKKNAHGIAKHEFEFNIPIESAREMIAVARVGHVVEKTRFKLTHSGNTWEIDEFHGNNNGLVIAELELDDEWQEFEMPPWLGKEITGERRYGNASLAMHPFSEW